MNIKQFRVDYRMLHGQICTAYGRLFGIDEFLVVNEEVSKDDFQISLLEMAALSNHVTVLSPKDAKTYIEEGKSKGSNVLVVFKEIEDALELVEEGLDISEIQIGGMFAKADRDRVQYDVALFADGQDKAVFRKLEDKGISLSFQVVPDYKAKKLSDLVEY